MVGRAGPGRRLIVGLSGAALLLSLLFCWQRVNASAAGALAADTCSHVGELRATTCRLLPGEAVADTLAAGEPAIFRVQALTPDSRLELTLTDAPGTTVAVVDWHGDELASAPYSADAPETHLSVTLALPGVYGVRIRADDPASTPAFRMLATIQPSGPVPIAMWPPTGGTDGDSLVGERQVIRTPRGGTPGGGVAIARALGAPPDSEVADFTLVADVHFDQIVGPSGLTVRFRYEPEAGGGSGYLLTLDPYAGEAYLDSFEEGRRHPVVARTKLPVELADDPARRLVLQASGPDMVASLDGQELLRASDGRYPRGLIAVGVVTWSEPVGVMFDHLLVLTPPS